jgi:signal transduction histidine kinase
MAGPGRRLPRDLDRILHDLRGPLNAVALHLQLLRHACGEQAEARPSLDTLDREVQRLNRMLDTAFAVVALELGHPAPLDLRALAEQVAGRFESVRLMGDHWPEVSADRDLLALAVTHLVRNALAATEAAGAARRPPEVRAEATPGAVTLVVEHWGSRPPTVDARTMIRLGEGSQPGEGLDLLVPDRVARLHGGSLEFSTRGPTGAELRLTLPGGPPDRTRAPRA